MNNVQLLENERIDDLEFNNLNIIQNNDLYCFTCDAVLLANFAKAKKTDKLLDLCSGSGIVGILTQAKNNNQNLTCVELQECMANMCNRSIQLNKLENIAKVVNCSVQEAPKVLGSEVFDVIVCNPPYKKTDSHKISEKAEIGICKYEIKLTFNELAKSVNSLLRFGGKFYFVHESCRLSELISTLKQNNLQPKRIKFVYPKKNANSHIVLIEAKKGAKDGLIIEPPIVL